uniref:uncharacterized protein LOC118146130 isoform X1 n=1 Tax=Callithrix jacchus TaxID=9483 RepID=UPI00159DFEA7|nr:uncharacterized protein LOC118146130 isoform X1 [Callithrix jacchus]
MGPSQAQTDEIQDLAEDGGKEEKEVEEDKEEKGDRGGGDTGGGDTGGGEGTVAMAEVETVDEFLPSYASSLHKWMFCVSPGNLDCSHSSLPMNFWFDQMFRSRIFRSVEGWGPSAWPGQEESRQRCVRKMQVLVCCHHLFSPIWLLSFLVMRPVGALDPSPSSRIIPNWKKQVD